MEKISPRLPTGRLLNIHNLPYEGIIFSTNIQTIYTLIPRSGTNTLGIIFFCLAFGTVLGSLGKAGKTVIDFFVVIDEVINKMVYGIMW